MVPRRLKLFFALAPIATILTPWSDVATASPKDRPLRIKVHASVVAGFPKQRAIGAIKPFLDRLAQPDQLNYPIVVDVHTDRGADSLLTLGEDLMTGKADIGAVWGIEYGWLRTRYPLIKPLVVAQAAEMLQYSAELVVKKDAGFDDLADLPNPTRIADFKGACMLNRLFLNDLNHELPHLKFQVGKQSDNINKAIEEVLQGRAEGVICDPYAFETIGRTQYGIRRKLKVIRRSATFPQPVLVGIESQINERQAGLCEDFQRTIVAVTNEPEGRDFVRFWRMEEFRRPDQAYLDSVEQAVKRYPPPFPPSK
jgi:ABC-type phosphate/phosphonate transport system substrate-binding protein